MRSGGVDPLLALMEDLSRGLTPKQVAEAVVGHAQRVLGAKLAILWMVEPDGSLRMLRWIGTTDNVIQPFVRQPRDAAVPIAEAISGGHPVWTNVGAQEGLGHATLKRVLKHLGVPDEVIVASLPLMMEGKAIGGLSIVFGGARPLDADEQDRLLVLAQHCAQALERARLFEAERRSRARLAILADATGLLAGSLDLEATVSAIGRLAVPSFADICLFYVIDAAGEPSQIAATAADPAQAEDLAVLGLMPIPRSGFWSGVLATGRAVLVPDVAEAQLRDDKPEQQSIARRIGFRSLLIVPLVSRGSVLGVATFATSTSGRSYDSEDLAMAEELGRRAGLALDNARLLIEAVTSAERSKQAEEELRRAYEIAKEADRRKDEFLAMLGHELRNPLSPIVTALDVMRMRDDGAAHDRERAVIERQVKHLIRLVDDLLDVSRITRGKVELRQKPTELLDVLAKAVEIASPLLEQRRHELVLEAPTRGLFVDADEVRMAQVLANLLTNAAKYTGPGGRIVVRAEKDGKEVRVSVKDNGIGIAPELLPSLFDLFVQGKRSSDRAEGGLGLGLALVKNLTELHGGTVEAKSEGLDRGSEFVVRLPLIATPSIQEAVANRRNSPPPTPSKRVLIVDDNRDAAELMGELLAAYGHDVTLAYDGPSALTLAETFAPEAAVLDIGLPVMDGYELASRLRDKWGRGIELIAVTGYGQDHDRARAREAGFDRHLVKPINGDELIAALTK